MALAALCAIMPVPESAGQAPIRLHPDNGHYFLFRDRPVVLVGSSEHYGALINLDFDYVPYLDEARVRGLNLIRVFAGTYREIAGSFGIPDNTLAPATARSVSPWKRTTTPGARDGGHKFDLNQWDPAYFSRLRDLVAQAGSRGIIVELTFFSAIYDDSLWNVSPMNAANHINGAGAGGRIHCYNASGDLVPFQKALVRKCATELNGYDNVIFEICNEPYNGGITQTWETLIVNELVATEADLPNRHVIAQNVHNYQGSVSNPHSAVSLFNFHYAYPNAATQNYGLNRALGDDETGFAGRADFTYRREAWEFLLSGGGLFNHLDFSFTATHKNGTSTQSAPGGGGVAIRHQLGVLRGLLEGLPLVKLVPQPGLVAGGVPSGGAVTAMGAPGLAYALYLRGGSQANLVVNLPSGTYSGQWINTKTGAVTASVADFNHPGGHRTWNSPAYSEDIALRVVAGTPPVTGPQALVNGSFESGFTGWSASGNLGIQPTSAHGGPHGAKLVAFNGGNLAPDGVLAQTFPTTAGATYALSFDAGVLAYNSVLQKLQVTVAGNSQILSQTVSLTGNSTGTTRWEQRNFTFVANSAATTLTFLDLSASTHSIDLLLDNVQVTGPPPAGGANTAPVASADSYSTPRDTVLSAPAAGVLTNDTDAQSDPLTAVLVTPPGHGSLVLNPDGGFSYTPASGYVGADSFTYRANDGSLNSNTATASITIHASAAGGLVNGSFESGSSGWTVTGNQAIVSRHSYSASHGSKLMVFNGGNATPNGILAQSFATIAGQTYMLAFDAGVLGYNTNSQTLQVTADGTVGLLSKTLVIHGSGGGQTRWLPQNFSFTANSAATTLTFRDLSSTTISIDLLLDNVSIVNTTQQGMATTVDAGTSGLTDTPRITRTGGTITLQMTAGVSGLYFLERSEDLVAWEQVGPDQSMEAGPIRFQDIPGPATQASRMFYRIGLRPEAGSD